MSDLHFPSPLYAAPNIDRIATEGVSFTDYYAQQSCTIQLSLRKQTKQRLILGNSSQGKMPDLVHWLLKEVYKLA